MCCRLAGALFGASVKLGRLEREHVIDIWDTDCSEVTDWNRYLHYTTRKPVGILITKLLCIRMDL